MKRFDLIDAFTQISDRRTMQRFFSEIFTPAEYRAFVRRWRILQLLMAGVPQRAIAARLGVSLCKITRGSRILKNRNSVSRHLLAVHGITAGSGTRHSSSPKARRTHDS